MNLSRTTFAAGLTLAALLAAPGVAPAAFITHVGPSTISGSGIGAVNTILTLNDTPDEAGSVRYLPNGVGGFADVITGDAQTGSSQTHTVTEAQLASISPGFDFSTNNLIIVMNLVEAGSENPPSVVLVELTVYFYDAAGNETSTTMAAVPITINQIGSGIGQSGEGFLVTGIAPGTVRIGLSATVDSTSAGHETFFVGNGGTILPEDPPVATPAPASLILALVGVAGLGGVGLRRRLRGAPVAA